MAHVYFLSESFFFTACLFFNLTETWFCWLGTSASIEGVVWSWGKSRSLSHRNWISWSCLCPSAVCWTKASENSKHCNTVDCHDRDDAESLLAEQAHSHVCTANSLFNSACAKFYNAVGRDTTKAEKERVIDNNSSFVQEHFWHRLTTTGCLVQSLFVKSYEHQTGRQENWANENTVRSFALE